MPDGRESAHRDGAVAIRTAIHHRFAWLRHVFADGGHAGGKLEDALHGHGMDAGNHRAL